MERIRSTMSGSVVRGGSLLNAAKDNGDAKTDRRRKKDLGDVVAEASLLIEETDPETFPDAVEAAKAVRDLTKLSDQLDAAARKLKAAPPGTDEAGEAQVVLDDLRVGIDHMLVPLTATFRSMHGLLRTALAIAEQHTEVEARLNELKKSLDKEKDRLKTAGNAVKSAAKIG